MRVLVACEFSGVVREAFRRLGHDAWSCDLLPAEDGNEFHLRGSVEAFLEGLPWPYQRVGRHFRRDYWPAASWDLMIAHPPCTYLSRAGARWWRDPARQALADKAAAFVWRLWEAPIPRVAIENPIGQLNRRWRYPDQVVQPWEFGHPFSKATCLWLRGLPPLMPTHICAEYRALLPSNVGRGRRLGQRSERGVTRSAKEASRTFKGIADAMALQWGGDARCIKPWLASSPQEALA